MIPALNLREKPRVGSWTDRDGAGGIINNAVKSVNSPDMLAASWLPF